jgi:glyoxylase-like metal-dependent hydrolase (beta-lactamase superfamily II)
MNKIISIVLIVASINAFAFDYNLEPKRVSKNTWCFFGKIEALSAKNGGFMSNSCYIKTNNHFVLIDSGASYNFAKQAYEAMSKIAKIPVKVVINTHDHDDHWLGNSFYKETFDAKLIGPSSINTNYNKDSKTRMFRILSKDTIKNTKIVKLDQMINKLTKIKIDNTEIIIIPVGTKAHTNKDLFIYIPNNKTLFSGDLVMNGRITSNRDGSVIGVLKALNMIKEQDYKTLISGHGLITDITATKQTFEYFKLLKQRVLKAIEDDVPAEEITQIVKIDEFKDKVLFKALNKRNIFGAFSELEFYEEE